jgi:SAM-dependent methyltransferase
MTSNELTAMIANDEHHWWYRGRRRVLQAVIDGLPLPAPARILDAGCGSGRTLDDLTAYGTAVGVDLSPAAVAAAERRGHYVRAGSVEALPFLDDAFDLVTCLDVVEHTPDDRLTLRELRRVTRPGGHLIVTVPAYPALWSAHDEMNLHYRRYTRRTLVSAAAEAGWAVARTTYFNAALVAPAAVVRLARRKAQTTRSELSLTPRALDRVLELPGRAEAGLMRAGGRLPAGLSLLAVLVDPARQGASVAPAPVHARGTDVAGALA